MTVEKLGMLDHKEKGVSLVLLIELTILVLHSWRWKCELSFWML